MTVTLISPQSDISAFGIRSLSAYLKKNGIPTKLIFLPDMKFDMEANENEIYRYSDKVLGQVAELCKDSMLVGISLFSCHFDRAIQLTDYLKEHVDAPVIWGGVHPTAAPEYCIEHSDIICLGEGEDTLLELTRRISEGRDYHTVPGLWVKKNGEIIKNPMMPLKGSLDDLPVPDYSLDEHYIFDKDKDSIFKMDEELLMKFIFRDPENGKPIYQTMVTRGCPHSCTYCFTFRNFYKGEKYLRHRSAENVIFEMEEIKMKFRKFEIMLISDDSFFAIPEEEIKKFAGLYSKKISLPFRCLGSPATVNEEKLACLVDAGLFQIQIGIETASEGTRKIYNRSITNKKVLDSVNTVNKFKARLMPFYDFITDNPYEKKEDFLTTLRFAASLPRPRHIQVFSLVFFPGTQLYYRALEDGLLKESDIIKGFRKQFNFEKETYMNFMLHLINFPIPGFIVAMLVSDFAVWFFDRKSTGKMLYWLLNSYKRMKSQRRYSYSSHISEEKSLSSTP
ncbi:MAG: B12-binding domain-containing radical SAM protein [Candidatus Schekmanbacteria bacterium]|nr:B12-binding domain-containing radical SAM protein [Candidatus Schekmanbacteria bacterium]